MPEKRGLMKVMPIKQLPGERTWATRGEFVTWWLQRVLTELSYSSALEEDSRSEYRLYRPAPWNLTSRRNCELPRTADDVVEIPLRQQR